MFRSRVLASLAPFAVAAGVMLASPSASAEVVVVDEGPSVEYLATVEPIYYEDRAVYWWHDHWYYRNAYGGWGYYGVESGFLYNRRFNAPPGRWSYEPHGWGGGGGRGWGGGGGHGWDNGGHGAPGRNGEHGGAAHGGGAAPSHGGATPGVTHGGGVTPAAPSQHPQPASTTPSAHGGAGGGGGWGGHGGGGGGGGHGGGGHR
jgi:hypothetical protein